LPPLLQSAKYKQFYHNIPGYKILDNGVAEGDQYSFAELIQMMAMNNFDELVIPDVMGDCDQTIHLIRKHAQQAKENPWYNYMAVVHGSNMAEVMKCIQAAYYEPYVTTIGLPRILVDTIHREARINLTHFILTQLGTDKQIHCLGSGSFMKEPLLLNEMDETPRGIDTSLPVYMGMLGKDITHDKYEKRPDDYFTTTVDAAQRKFIGHNVDTYRAWCGAPSPLSS
jgi:hypothetical protein